MIDLAQDTSDTITASMNSSFIGYSFSYIRRRVGLLQHIAEIFAFTWSNISFMYSIFNVLYSGAPARAKRARSGAPWVRKFGKLSIPENLVMT